MTKYDGYPWMDEEVWTHDWDCWAREAVSRGISFELAAQGRAVLRESYQHWWRNYFEDELEWEAMLQLALNNPDYAMNRWYWLEISDGESEHMTDFLSQETIEQCRIERRLLFSHER